ncbi:MAG: beta-galactosidase [Bacteroidota bacterium]|nr:Tat pathway signal protein [Odoribacter sp.]MDP3644498.1 beta-galactosidase [Bacteroidota bacterium]
MSKSELKHLANPYGGHSRRSFLKKTAAASVLLAGGDLLTFGTITPFSKRETTDETPWYRRVTRWGQTNITEKDPAHYDIAWWRNYWKETQTQGVIINAGGIVAYYPSNVPLHRQAQFLEGRDLFGDLCRAAHEDGLVVFARMDSNRAHEEFYKAHPDWFAIDKNGNPYKAGELFITCVNSPYYNEHIPSILTEVSNLYHPEGFTDNSWSGLGRDSICYCENCKKSFREKTDHEIPLVKNWDDQVYREWIRWNYDRRLEIWDLNNRTTKAAGGPDCIWSGMNGSSISGQSRSFRDYKEICKRADIIMLDSQARSDADGFQQNADSGKLIHGMLGWDKLIPESMAQYQMGRPTFRLASKPVAEARMWMIEGIAGGIQPWWHYVGASHEDRRIYHTAGPIFRWHKANEEFLINRKPVATVGVVWSQQNMDFYGRDETDLMVELPWRGIIQALIRARIPYLPVHADHIDREAKNLAALILPNLGLMTDNQIASVKRFVEGGGGLLATGESSLYNQWGDRRSDYALGDTFGAHLENQQSGNSGTTLRKRSGETYHTYLRLTPELRKNLDGPQTGLEPQVSGDRHPVLKGFDETDILSFGGSLDSLKIDSGVEVLMTFIPQFPIYPPETAWMREPKTDIPGLILNTSSGGGPIAFLPADLDRQYGRYNLPDHGNLLANLIRWAAKDEIPLAVECAGLIDCNLYRQSGRLILHLVNLTSAGTWRQPTDEYIPISPVKVRVKLPGDMRGKNLHLLVSDQKISSKVEKGWVQFTVSSILDHEVVVIT